jgi:hypothetical protein
VKAYYVYYNGTRKRTFYSGMEAAKWVSAEIRTGANEDLFVITSNPNYRPEPPEVLL